MIFDKIKNSKNIVNISIVNFIVSIFIWYYELFVDITLLIDFLPNIDIVPTIFWIILFYILILIEYFVAYCSPIIALICLIASRKNEDKYKRINIYINSVYLTLFNTIIIYIFIL